MTNILENLSWLPQPPADFSSRLSLASNGADLRELANFSLNENQLRKLSKRLYLLKKDKKDLSRNAPGARSDRAVAACPPQPTRGSLPVSRLHS